MNIISNTWMWVFVFVTLAVIFLYMIPTSIASNVWTWVFVFSTSVIIFVYNSLTYSGWGDLLLWDGFSLLYMWISAKNIIYLRGDSE